mmetsp:Transcript_6210/g.15061  ORF Transcript_6210/g.15061 Transcript_6210/m.15061 type:complete len:115 (+) Transcript_6210:376-720(+)
MRSPLRIPIPIIFATASPHMSCAEHYAETSQLCASDTFCPGCTTSPTKITRISRRHRPSQSQRTDSRALYRIARVHVGIANEGWDPNGHFFLKNKSVAHSALVQSRILRARKPP